MITTDFVFDRRKTATTKKLGTVEIRVTVNRKNQYISTGMRLYKSEWKFGQIVNRPDCQELMNRLNTIRIKLEKEVTKCIAAGITINLQAIRDGITINSNNAMYPQFKNWIEGLNICDGTRNHYRKMLRRLEEFGEIKQWEDCNVENIRKFDTWLHQIYRPHTTELISDAGVYNYHKNFKALLNIAYSEGKINTNPYLKLRGKIKRGDRDNVEYLLESEMLVIENIELSNRIFDEARDLFVFQMYTGLSYSDLNAFDISEYKEINGRWINRTERIKTGIAYINVLLPPAVRILRKYNYKLPKINNAEYNERLKVIGRLACITQKLHSHLARHTFATYMLSNGVNIEHVSKMLGHTNISQTQRYAKVLAKDIRDSFERIEKKLNKEGN